MAIIQSGASADNLTVDPTSKAARSTLYDTSGNPAVVTANAQPTTVSAVVTAGLNDRSIVPFRTDRLGSQATTLFTQMLQDSFEGTTIHPLRWTITNTTMAATQATVAGLTINSGSITTINTGYMIQSSKKFIKSQRVPMQMRARARLIGFNNSVMELGFGDAPTFSGANTAGAYWQMTSTGVLQPVITYNSADITGTDIRSLVSNNNYYTFDIIMDDDNALFTCQDSATGLLISKESIQLPITGQRLISQTQISAQARVYNTGSAPATAPQMLLTDIIVVQLDMQSNKPYADAMSLNDRSAWENPFTGAQLATWTNSAEPASATLSNTAAGYTTLGGKFQFAAVAGAATDYALFGFTVPTPATLVVTGIDIECWNTVTAVATTPTLLTWALGFGSTAVSLATAGIVRVPIGAQSFPVGAAVGAKAERISRNFRTPISVGAGRFLHVILRMPVGTATATEVFAGMVNIEGYFE